MKKTLMVLAAGAVALTVAIQAQQAPVGVRPGPAQPANIARAASNTQLSAANLAVVGEMPEAVELMSASIGAALPPRPITYGRPPTTTTPPTDRKSSSRVPRPRPYGRTRVPLTWLE